MSQKFYTCTSVNYGLPFLRRLNKFNSLRHCFLDMFSVMMAACSSDCDGEERIVECLTILIEKGAKINSHDRYSIFIFYFRTCAVIKEFYMILCNIFKHLYSVSILSGRERTYLS